jgi:hypothetical protein
MAHGLHALSGVLYGFQPPFVFLEAMQGFCTMLYFLQVRLHSSSLIPILCAARMTAMFIDGHLSHLVLLPRSCGVAEVCNRQNYNVGMAWQQWNVGKRP